MLKQLSVFVENNIGSLARVTGVFKRQGINIRAIAAFDSPDFGILRVIVDKPEAAKAVLEEKGFAVKITEVLAVELEDRPGHLDEVLSIIADNGFNLNYIYSFVLRDKKEPLMVMNTDHMAEASGVLMKHNIVIAEIDQEERNQ